MGRLARRRLGRGVYHVYNRAHGGAWVLAEPQLKRQFLDRLVRFLSRQEVQVYHWAIMSNHFHLAAEALTPTALSGWLPRVCRSYSRWYHRVRGGQGCLWQGRFRSVLVEKDGYLPRLGRYIERNPVRAGVSGVRQAWDYEWSSARHYAQGAADPLVAGDGYFFYVSMGAAAGQRQRTYRQYLRDARERATEEALLRGPAPALGSADFLANLRRVAGHLTARARGRPRQAERV
jgi:putative transposase